MNDIVPIHEARGMTREVLPLAVLDLKERAEDCKRRMVAVQGLMRDAMQEGVHYGKIPGANKPSLHKGGAQMLGVMFRLRVETVILTEVLQESLVHYTIRCDVYEPSGAKIAAGIGSCSSLEAKYKYRKTARKCPSCGSEAIIKGKEEYGGGWVCFKKKGGCGAKWPDGAAAIESQSAGQVLNDELGDLRNTILKMAKKRAFVDGIMDATAVADIFTQDLEDLYGEAPAHERQRDDDAPPPRQHRDVKPANGSSPPSGYDVTQERDEAPPAKDPPKPVEKAATTSDQDRPMSDGNPWYDAVVATLNGMTSNYRTDACARGGPLDGLSGRPATELRKRITLDNYVALRTWLEKAGGVAAKADLPGAPGIVTEERAARSTSRDDETPF